MEDLGKLSMDKIESMELEADTLFVNYHHDFCCHGNQTSSEVLIMDFYFYPPV